MNRISYAPKVPQIQALLAARGWTWARLAREAGRGRTHLCRVMGGHHRATPAFAEDVAAALQVEVGDVWDGGSDGHHLAPVELESAGGRRA